MRLFEITEEPNIDEIIERDCQPFLNQAQGGIVYRGTYNDLGEFSKITIRQDRRPVSFNGSEHKLILKAFAKAGFEANRNNSMFCSGSVRQARSYGKIYKVFPIGEFSFTWSNTVRDLYETYMGWAHEHKATQVFDPHLLLKDTWYNTRYPEQGNRRFVDFMKGQNPNNEYMMLSDDTDPPHVIKFPQIYDLIKNNYQSTDLHAAIKSENEIMIACKEAYMVKV